MNYRHAFHAGNLGDVLKHAALGLVLEHLKAKPAPFFVLDTHAGRGFYDLAGTEAERTGEWREGIGKLWADPPEGNAGLALAPWFSVIKDMNPDGALRRYPGSPALIAKLKRAADRAAFYERHPDDARALTRRFADHERMSVHTEDGWPAIAKLLPPIERRGLVLIDPPFEEHRDYVRLSEALAAAHRRFATGTFLLWYPVKGTIDRDGLLRAVEALGIPKTMRIELHSRKPNNPGRFDGAGLIAVNPPFTLKAHLEALLPALALRFQTGPGAGHVLEWIQDDGAAKTL